MILDKEWISLSDQKFTYFFGAQTLELKLINVLAYIEIVLEWIYKASVIGIT